MRWVFVRHLEVQKGSPAELVGHRDVFLTAKGLEEVSPLAARLAAQYSFNRIYSSPLTRCRTLALELERVTGISLREDARLKEIHWGEWEGKTLESVYAGNPAADLFRPPGGESIEQFSDRVRRFLSELENSSADGETVLVVTHGGVIRILVLEVFALSYDRFWDFKVDYGGVTEVVFHPDGRKRLGCLNRFWPLERFER